MAAPKLIVMCQFLSERDGRWYVVVSHGDMIEHLRLRDRDDGPACLVRQFGLKLPAAKRLFQKVEVAK